MNSVRREEVTASAFRPREAGLPATALGLPGVERDELTRAALDGEKTATTSLLNDYILEDEPLPVVGSRYQLQDSNWRTVAIIEVTAVRVSRFDDVDLAHARDEGEGFTTVEQWRAAHRLSWPGIGDDAKLVLERFRVVDRA